MVNEGPERQGGVAAVHHYAHAFDGFGRAARGRTSRLWPRGATGRTARGLGFEAK